MTPIATLVTGLLIGSGGTWLFVRTRRGANSGVQTATVEPIAQTAPAAATKRRWQMPSFRRKQPTVVDAPATNEATTEAVPTA